MIGKDEKEEEVSFKVADRRKFNPDGSLKDGVTFEPEPAKPASAEPSPAAAAAAVGSPAEEFEEDDFPPDNLSDENNLDSDFADEEKIPGAKDPASFVNFLSTIATNAAAALGAVPHPSTGKRMLDLDSGKYWLDVLGMIKEKTKGNLHPEEGKILDVLLSDLRMQYVQMVRATEEKLKAQAAAKFSGDDILGRK